MHVELSVPYLIAECALLEYNRSANLVIGWRDQHRIATVTANCSLLGQMDMLFMIDAVAASPQPLT
jgi:hypothetical protein